MSAHETWFLENNWMLERLFGAERITFEWPEVKYLQISQYPLPTNWMQLHTSLLMVFDNPANIFVHPPDRFYLNRGLRTVHGEIPTHYFEGEGYNDLSNLNWARYSFHIQDNWHPERDVESGSTLLDVLDALHISLTQAGDCIV